MILFISLFFLFLCILFVSILIKDNRINTVENSIRIYSVFTVLVVFPLLVLCCLYFGKVNGIPFYASFPKLFSSTFAENKTVAIATLFAHIFIVFAGLSIPISTIFYFSSGYKKLLKYYNKKESIPDSQGEHVAVTKLKTLFSNALKTASLNTEIKFLILDRSTDVSSPFFTECGVIGTGKNVMLVLSREFIKLFETGKLSEQEIEAIFLHEISHVHTKDLFLPLWAKSIAASNAFIISTLAGMLAFIAGFFVKDITPEHLVIFLVIFPVSIYLFRIGILQIIAHVMREREYLADARAGFYVSSDILVKAIKKAAIFFPRLNAIFLRGESFSEKSVMIKTPDNFKEFLTYSRWNLYCFFKGKTYWHPSAQDRVKAIEEKRNIAMQGNVGLLSPASVLGISFLSCLTGFFILLAYSLTEIGKADCQSIAISISFILSLLLVFLSCLPLRTFDRKSIGFLFRKGKFWREMLLNSLFISEFNILFLVLGSVNFPYSYMLWLFLLCITSSLLFVGISYLVKKVDKNQQGNKFLS